MATKKDDTKQQDDAKKAETEAKAAEAKDSDGGKDDGTNVEKPKRAAGTSGTPPSAEGAKAARELDEKREAERKQRIESTTPSPYASNLSRSGAQTPLEKRLRRELRKTMTTAVHGDMERKDIEKIVRDVIDEVEGEISERRERQMKPHTPPDDIDVEVYDQRIHRQRVADGDVDT